LLASRWFAWLGVWTLHACVLVTYPLWEPPSACAAALKRAAIHCGWVAAAARLSRAGLPAGLAAMAALACASPAAAVCAGPRAAHRAALLAAQAYPAGCALAGIAALTAAARAARRDTPSDPGAAAASPATWHPLGEPEAHGL
jgi:hypothetical protein